MDRGLPPFFKPTVYRAEVSAPKKTAVRAQRARMWRFQHHVFRMKFANLGCVTSGVPAPQQKDHRSVHEGAQNGLGEGLPTKGRMAARGTWRHRQHIVEQQHPLPRPALQIS